MSAEDFAHFARPRDGGWLYELPNDINILVLPVRTPLRFETRVSGGWQVMERHGGAVIALQPQRADRTSSEVEELVAALAALPGGE